MEKNYEEYVAGLMKRARAAQKIINDYSQEQIDELVKAIAFYTTRPDYMRKVAEMCVEESGMGDLEDKIGKIWNKTMGHYIEMKEEKSLYRWPHAVYFRALYALWSKSGNERYLEKMRKHYLSDTPENYKKAQEMWKK